MNDETRLDGRLFRSAGAVADGEVSADTLFTYHEKDGLVWARYAGGAVRLGFLVGTRAGDQIDFRYAQVNEAGESATGHCRSAIERLDDGRLRLVETWEWESREGSGTSVVEEVQR